MFKPEIGISMLYCLGRPFKEMTKLIPSAGTFNIEIVDEGYHTLNKPRVARLIEIAQSHAINYCVHAPFGGVNIATPYKPLLNAMLKRLKRSITMASNLGCKLWIFHPGMATGIGAFYPGMEWKGNMESIHLLWDFASKCGVKVGLENGLEAFIMKTADDFERFYSETDDDIGFVLDTGHANISGQLGSFMTQLRNRIVHVHAHDNKGRFDQHLGIGDGSIDWENFATLAREIPQRFAVSVESVEKVQESLDRLSRLFF